MKIEKPTGYDMTGILYKLCELIDMVNMHDEVLDQYAESCNASFKNIERDYDFLKNKIAALEMVLAENSAFPKYAKVGSWEWALEKLKQGKWIKSVEYASSIYMEEGKIYLFNPFSDDVEIEILSIHGDFEIAQNEYVC